jgi:hypothetical protein
MLPQVKEKVMDLYESVGSFIQMNKRFRLLTATEVGLAASWNAAGEFGEKAKHWQQELNLDYLGDLLNLYCRHKAKFNLYEKLERESIKHLPSSYSPDPFFWEREIELRYQQFLKDKCLLSLWLPGMYNKLVDFNFIPPGYFVFHLRQAYAKVLDEISTELAELKSQGKALHKTYERLARVNEYKHSNHYVLYLAKRLSVREYFKHCKDMGYKNLFVEEKS